MFEGTLLGIQGPMEREALTARAVLAGEASMTELALSISAEIGSVWVLGAVAVANVALGVWRPRKKRITATQ